MDLKRSELTKGSVSIEMRPVTQVASGWVNTGCVVTGGHVEFRGGLK